MKITYIGHSSFMAELEKVCLLFDYFKGKVPKTDKKLFVFVSHFHADHYNPEIFSLSSEGGITYILSRDIKIKNRADNIITVSENETYMIGDIRVETLKSTDSGVAFIVTAEGKTIYHSGDLNLWVWSGETKQYNKNMRANFELYTKPLCGRKIDVGFIPLDPRQEGDYSAGMDCFLNLCSFGKIFPMHFWGKYDIINKYKAERQNFAPLIENISYEGQTWEV